MISSTGGNARSAISGIGSPPPLAATGRHRGPGRLTDDDPADHAGMLVRDAEEVVDALRRERDREALVRQQVVRVPGLGTLRDAQRALEVPRMVGRGRMGVARVQVDPADRLARLDAEADRIEPDMRAIGIALHPDLDRFRGERKPGPCQTGEEAPADLQDMSARDHHFAATRCLVGLRNVPQDDMRMGLLDPRMAGVEVDVHMIDLAAGRGEIVEALVLVGEVLDGQHVDRADEPPLAVVGQERAGRQGLGIDIELAEPRQEVGQLHELAHLLVGARGRSLLDLVGGAGRHGKGDGDSNGSKAGQHVNLQWCD